MTGICSCVRDLRAMVWTRSLDKTAESHLSARTRASALLSDRSYGKFMVPLSQIRDGQRTLRKDGKSSGLAGLE